MSEWWTYTLKDFLLFSPRTYARLFELYNAAIWPAQLAALALGVAIVVLWRRGGAASGRLIAAILAACWLWIAIAFHALRYATINTAGLHFAWAFGVEAVPLLGLAVSPGRPPFQRPANLAGRAGFWMFLFALAVEPLAAPLLGRGWKSVELFGVAPDPTAVATLGILLAARIRHRWLWMLLPALWCATTGVFLLAMKAPDFWIPPLAAVLAVVLVIGQKRSARRERDPSPRRA